MLAGFGCFAAGTPLLTPEGDKNIEDLRPGDLILTRTENDPNGLLVAKPIEDVFWRAGDIIELQVRDRLIRTTSEHPFWVLGKGWLSACELMAGDWLSSHDGEWVRLGGLRKTGVNERVYNVQVAEHHSYFVGARHWGFSVWAHNAAQCNVRRGGQGAGTVANLNSNAARSRFGIYEIKVNGSLYKVGKADMNRVTQSSGLPTRLHQQVRKLSEIYGGDNVTYRLKGLGNTTTKLAKAAETARLQAIWDKLGFVPLGNIKSFFPV